MTRIVLRARRRVLWLRQLWSVAPAQSEQWLAISHSEVDRILDGPLELAAREAVFYAVDPACRALSEAVEAADHDAAADERWLRLRDRLGLDTADLDLLALAVAAQADPALRRLYGYLRDETTPVNASPCLAAALFQWSAGTNVRAGTPLLWWALAHPSDRDAQPADPTAEWVADHAIVPWLAFDEPLRERPEFPDATDACLYPQVLEAMERFVRAVRAEASGTGDPATRRPVELELVARPVRGNGPSRPSSAPGWDAACSKRMPESATRTTTERSTPSSGRPVPPG